MAVQLKLGGKLSWTWGPLYKTPPQKRYFIVITIYLKSDTRAGMALPGASAYRLAKQHRNIFYAYASAA
jgi:hypothetical protein